MNEEKLVKIIEKALDHIGLEIRIWKEDYFGPKPEEELIKRLAKEIIKEIK